MSWTPDMMIRRSDYETIKKQIPSHNGWAMRVLRTDMVVLNGGECSIPNRDLHDALKHVEHWIINGEGSACSECVCWGESLAIYLPDEP